jgi:hypothetical protein
MDEASIDEILGAAQQTLWPAKDVPPERNPGYFSDEEPKVIRVSKQALDNSSGGGMDYDDFQQASAEEVMGKEALEEFEVLAKLQELGISMEGFRMDEETTVSDIVEFLNGDDVGRWDNTYNWGWWGPTMNFGEVTGPDSPSDPYEPGILFCRMHRGGDVRGNYGPWYAFDMDSFGESDAPWYRYFLTVNIETNRGSISLMSSDTEGYRFSVSNDETGAFKDEGDSEELTTDEIEDRLDWEDSESGSGIW